MTDLIERLTRKCDGTNEADAATMAEAAAYIAQLEAENASLKAGRSQWVEPDRMTLGPQTAPPPPS